MNKKGEPSAQHKQMRFAFVVILLLCAALIIFCSQDRWLASGLRQYCLLLPRSEQTVQQEKIAELLLSGGRNGAAIDLLNCSVGGNDQLHLAKSCYLIGRALDKENPRDAAHMYCDALKHFAVLSAETAHENVSLARQITHALVDLMQRGSEMQSSTLALVVESSASRFSTVLSADLRNVIETALEREKNASPDDRAKLLIALSKTWGDKYSDRALDAAQKALGLCKPGSAVWDEANSQLISVYVLQTDWTQVLACFERYENYNASILEDPSAVLQLALREGKYALAARVARRSIEASALSPRPLETTRYLIRALVAQGKWAEAQQCQATLASYLQSANDLRASKSAIKQMIQLVAALAYADLGNMESAIKLMAQFSRDEIYPSQRPSIEFLKFRYALVHDDLTAARESLIYLQSLGSNFHAEITARKMEVYLAIRENRLAEAASLINRYFPEKAKQARVGDLTNTLNPSLSDPAAGMRDVLLMNLALKQGDSKRARSLAEKALKAVDVLNPGWLDSQKVLQKGTL